MHSAQLLSNEMSIISDSNIHSTKSHDYGSNLVSPSPIKYIFALTKTKNCRIQSQDILKASMNSKMMTDKVANKVCLFSPQPLRSQLNQSKFLSATKEDDDSK